MQNYITSHVRTIVPMILATPLAWLVEQGVDIDTEGTIRAVTLLVAAVLYTVVRAAENRWPAAGWLLGAKAQPSYDE